MFRYLLTGILISTISCLYGQSISPNLINVLESQICLQPRRCMPKHQCNNFVNFNRFGVEIRSQSNYNENVLLSFEMTSRNKILLGNRKEAEVCEHTERCCGNEPTNLSNNYLNSIVTNTGSGYGRDQSYNPLPNNNFPVTSAAASSNGRRGTSNTLPNTNLPATTTGSGYGRDQSYNPLPNNNFLVTSAAASSYGRRGTSNTLPNTNLPATTTGSGYGRDQSYNPLPNNNFLVTSAAASSYGRRGTSNTLPNTNLPATTTGSGYGRDQSYNPLPNNNFPVTSAAASSNGRRGTSNTLPNTNLPATTTGSGYGRDQSYNPLPNNNFPVTSAAASSNGRRGTSNTLPNTNLPATTTGLGYLSSLGNTNLPNKSVVSSTERQNNNLPVPNPSPPNTDINSLSRRRIPNLGKPYLPLNKNGVRNNRQTPTIGCGYRPQKIINPSKRANTNEQKAESGEFPWIIALLVQKPDDMKMKFVCGGSLIHPRVVVTALHCINRKAKETIKVRAGDSSHNFQIRNATEIIQHEDYNELSAINDIALIVVYKPYHLNDFIQTICLPTVKMPTDNEQHCYSAGWDRVLNDPIKKTEYILTKTEVRVIPSTTCQNELRQTRLGLHFQLHASFKCASGPNGRDTCTGDGGTPLICPTGHENNRFYQTGILSWGIACEHNNVPGVYVDVSVQRAWIDRKMADKQFGTQHYT